jgi:beta propeller repeat protein
MKTIIVIGSVCLWSIVVLADWPPIPVSTATGNQTSPAIDDSLVVWADTRGGSSIYGRQLPNTSEFVVFTSLTGACGNPAVNGNIAVWQDTRNSATTGIDIYGIDLNNLAAGDFPICIASGDQQRPDISGRIVVWQDDRNGIASDIFGIDLDNLMSGDFPICIDGATQSSPAISGSRVVWVDNRYGTNDILGIDLSNLPAGEIEICRENTADQDYPDISGNVVVWHDLRNGDTDIFGYDLSGGGEFPICVFTERQNSPAISGNWVVWRDRRNNSTSGYDIYACNIKQVPITPEPICTVLYEQIEPAVSSRYIVWQSKDGNVDWNIYGAALPVNAAVTVIEPNGGEQWLANGRHTVQWQTTGDPVSEVKIEFSASGGSGWSTLADHVSNTGSYLCTIPDANSVNCLIRVSIPGTAIYDTSDAVFTVFQCDAALTADVTGDCFVDLADVAEMSKQWLLCGHPTDPLWCQ